MNSMRLKLIAIATLAVSSLGWRESVQQADSLPTIRRTEYGVPHILARDFRGIGIGLGYTQVEDYGERVIMNLLRAKGHMGLTFGRDSMNSDFNAMREQARVQETYHLLDASTRGVLEGFAEGVNIFIRSHPERSPAWAKPIFTGHDVAALDVVFASTAAARTMVLNQLRRDSTRRAAGGQSTAGALGTPVNEAFDEPVPVVHPDDGSNAWSLAPSRTKSGRAIMLRNPHLAWNSGYWEAHVTIPGVINFYGDFRIGGPFIVIGGFNEYQGFATTNNAVNNDEVYAIDADTTAADRYIFDGASVPFVKEEVTVEFSTPTGIEKEVRTFLSTHIGPIAHRTREKIYIVRAGNDGDYRAGEQFLRLMLAKSHKEWMAAMDMRARSTSNFTYADRDGNIFNIWMASAPSLPHPWSGDTIAIPAKTSSDIWTKLVPLESLPQTLNPRGGYVHNENDAPYYANLHNILDTLKYPAFLERPDFALRSQHAVQLIDNKKKYSLEDVVRLKHSMRMLLADRVKPDLLKAVRASNTTDTVVLNAARVLEKWDNTVAAGSRGGVLFETWWRRYSQQAGNAAYAERWTPAKLTTTPTGLGRPELVVETLVWAAADMQRRYGSADVAWGDVHRVRRGNVDVPVGGCTGALGCFRVLSYSNAPDGKRVANSGDGWVLAVEFGKKVPRAYSILAYGQSPDSTSPHHADQAAMFAKGEMKPVRFTEEDIVKHAIRTYRPGDRR